MTAAACYPPSARPAPTGGVDILRGAGLLVSVTIILVAPAVLAVLALLQG